MGKDGEGEGVKPNLYQSRFPTNFQRLPMTDKSTVNHSLGNRSVLPPSLRPLAKKKNQLTKPQFQADNLPTTNIKLV